MHRATLTLISFALLATTLSGCLGDDGGEVNSGIPVAKVTKTYVDGAVDTVRFDASRSTGVGLKYEWDFGDGTTGNEAVVDHTYEFGDGNYSASLLITDANGVTDLWEDFVTIGSGENQPPEGLFTPSTRYLEVNQPLTVDASLSSDNEGDPITYVWDFNYLMTPDEYEVFREAKSGAAYDAAAGPAKSDPLGHLPAAIEQMLDKSPGHSGPEPDPVSLFAKQVETEEPVYTLTEGFPDATTFYVRLVAVDVKGSSQEIFSEEVWPVKVVETSDPEVYSNEFTGTFQLGGPEQLTQNTPDDETANSVYDDDASNTFTIPKNVQTIYINVTWSQAPTEGTGLPNDLDLYVLTPNGKERNAIGTTDALDGIVLKMLGAEDLGKGDWSFTVVARQGANIEWTVSYWAKVDLNPFAELEAPYLDA